MYDIAPFLIVLTIYLLATISMFFALNTGYNITDCFMLIYRLVVLGDGNVKELENREVPHFTFNISSGHMAQSDSSPTGNFHVVRAMMVVASFVIGVSLMNLFLAMLCVSYSAAHDAAHLSFMRCRAHIVLDQHAVRVGLTRFLCRFKKESAEKIVYRGTTNTEQINTDSMSRSTPRISANSLFDSGGSSKQAFLWFAKQTDFEYHN